MKIARFVIVCCLLITLVPAAASAWWVSAGWVRADVGLHEDGDGLSLGFGNRTQLTGWLDLSWSVDYVQKKGAQPSVFTNETEGIIGDDAEVTLHYIQPTAYLGAGMADWPLRPRLFLGGAAGLKWKEKWNDFPGDPAVELAYKDSDFVGIVGATLGMGPIDLDIRYTKGFGSSLIYDTTDRGQTKAEDDLPGVDVPEIGKKIETFQVGVIYSF
jgi:hypothetical protein